MRQFSSYNFNLQVAYIDITKQTVQYIKRIKILDIVKKQDLTNYHNQKNSYSTFIVIDYANSSYMGNINN